MHYGINKGTNTNKAVICYIYTLDTTGIIYMSEARYKVFHFISSGIATDLYFFIRGICI